MKRAVHEALRYVISSIPLIAHVSGCKLTSTGAQEIVLVPCGSKVGTITFTLRSNQYMACFRAVGNGYIS